MNRDIHKLNGQIAELKADIFRMNDECVKITRPLKLQIAEQAKRISGLEAENDQLTTTCLAAGFIGDGTQIIGDKRYEQLIATEAKVQELFAEIHEDIFFKSPRGQVVKGEDVRMTRATKVLSIIDELKALAEKGD